MENENFCQSFKMFDLKVIYVILMILTLMQIDHIYFIVMSFVFMKCNFDVSIFKFTGDVSTCISFQTVGFRFV